MPAKSNEISFNSGCEHGLEVRAIRHGQGDQDVIKSLVVTSCCSVCDLPVEVETGSGLFLAPSFEKKPEKKGQGEKDGS